MDKERGRGEMSNQRKISVVVATYRRERELKRALDSLALQTMDDFEIILVDDNDESGWNVTVRKIVDDFKETYKNIPVVYLQNHPNLGSARTRNAGIAEAQGNYITFLDDDDIYLPEKLKVQYEFMVSNNLDFSVTELALYYDDGKLSEYRKRDYIEKTDTKSLLQYHMMYHLTGTDTMMFTREYLAQIGGFAPIDVGDEFYLMERAIRGNGRFGCLKRCDVKAFVHKGTGGLSSGQSKIDGENKLFEYKKQFFREFDRKSVRYIKMRHHAVLAFAFIRQKKMAQFFKEAVLAFISAPCACIDLFFAQII